MGVAYTLELKAEYRQLWETCKIKSNMISVIDRTVHRILAGRKAYDEIAVQIGCPWFMVGVVHALEGSLRFDRHLHNGDPLTARTIHVPADRPPTGEPPFTFQDSAVDALKLRKWDDWHQWTVPGILWQLEGYNGFGYRQYHPTIKSPYLWSMTNHYLRGKYVADGKFSPTAISQQIGAAAILKRMSDLHLIQIV